MESIALLVIDPQNDFMDIPGAALPVPGASADMARVAGLVDRLGDRLASIFVTLDSHHSVGVERPGFWRTAEGGPVAPFTQVTAAQVRSGRFRPARADDLSWLLDYLDRLEGGGRYTLMVWPVHCEIGTWGHNVVDVLRSAYNRWEQGCVRPVRKVLKGMNPRTESYSALQAEVPDAMDPATQLNLPLIRELDQFGEIVIAGEASSHCVRATTEHLAANLPSGNLGKLVILRDGMSPVPGFERQAQDFLAGMAARGARVTTVAEYLAGNHGHREGQAAAQCRLAP